MRHSLFSVLIFTAIMLSAQDEISQSYIISKKGDITIALGDIDRKIISENIHSDKVFQNCVLLLSEYGGEIIVKPGIYEFHKPLVLESRIKISGSGTSSILKLAAENREGIVLHSNGKAGITLCDFACQGVPSHENSAGIVLEATGLSIIRNVYAHDFSGYGIWLREHSFANKLCDNYTSGNDRAGTFIQKTLMGNGGRFVPNNIDGCVSYAENGHGFEFERAICQNMVGCLIYLPKGDGIYMHNSTSNLISGCRVFMGFKNGVTIEDTYEMNISSNIIGWNHGHNLVLNHCVWGTVSANEFIDAGGRKEPQYGIYMHKGTKAMQISANAIFNWWDNQIMKGGIYEAEDCMENQITDNTINYYRDEAVYSAGQNSVTDYNLALPHPYGSPGKGPDVPNVKPEDIELRLNIEESREIAEKYLQLILQKD